MLYNFLKKTIYEIYKITKKEIGIVNEKKEVIFYFGSHKKEDVENMVKEISNSQSNINRFLDYSYIKLKLPDEKKNFCF